VLRGEGLIRAKMLLLKKKLKEIYSKYLLLLSYLKKGEEKKFKVLLENFGF